MKSIKKKITQQIKSILEKARTEVVRNVNKTIALTYFEIGKLLVTEHQNGKSETLSRKSHNIKPDFMLSWSCAQGIGHEAETI